MSRRLGAGRVGVLLVVVGVFGFGIETPIYAEEFRPLYRGARAQAMGNAFTAVADDEQAIFYNPAGLAGITNFSWNIAAINGDFSNDILSSNATLQAALANPSPSAINSLIGKNYSLRAQGLASLIGPGFGFAGLYDYQGAIRIKNSALPQGIAGAQNTYGGQVALGFRLIRFKRRKAELRMGFAGKLLYRSGGYFSPTLTEIMTLNSSLLTSRLGNPGVGFGLDTGLQLVYPVRKNFQLQAGLAMRDIGDTTFNNGSGEVQKSNLAAGLAGIYSSNDVRLIVAFDMDRIVDYIDWRRKVHLGTELKFPLLSFSAGLSEFQVTYGASINLGLFRVSYVSYAQEQGTVVGEDPERRHLLHVAFKFEI